MKLTSLKHWRHGLILMMAMAAAPTMVSAQTQVLFQTPLGNFVVEMFDDDAPATVANFMQYVADGDYNNSFIHRSVPGFVVQGGGFIFDEEGNVVNVPTDPPVVNEFNRSNTRGTIAMAKLGGDPNSATSQWFFNLADNSDNLDDQNGGFTAFGQVIGEGMEVVDAIASLQRWNAGQGFEELPLIDYPGNNVAIDETHIVFTEISAVSGIPFNAGLNGSWFNADTSGQGFFLDYFPDINVVLLAWFTYDVAAPDAAATSTIGDPGNRWITAQGSATGNVGDLDVIVTSGGLFDDPDAPAMNSPAGSTGTIMLTFEDCSNGLVVYNFPAAGLSGSVPISRLAPDNVALCDQLVANGGVLAR